MAYLVTFLEGIITFVSPCLLPLLPVYVAYFAGGVSGQDAQATPEGPSESGRLARTLLCAFGFVLGFGLLFTLMGAFAGSVGGFFTAHQRALNIVCGVIVVFFGLHFMGVINIPVLQGTHRLAGSKEPRGFFSSVLFGIVFAVGWTPCVGAFLGSALSLAASSGSTLQGVLLLGCYSLGLGIPFVISAVLVDRLEGAFSWVKAHYRIVNMASGILLVAVGVLMATGHLGTWLALLAG